MYAALFSVLYDPTLDATNWRAEQACGPPSPIGGVWRQSLAILTDLLRDPHPRVAAALLNGRLTNFSSSRLMRLLAALGQDVEITIRTTPRRRARGRISIREASA